MLCLWADLEARRDFLPPRHLDRAPPWGSRPSIIVGCLFGSVASAHVMGARCKASRAGDMRRAYYASRLREQVVRRPRPPVI